MSIEKPNGVPGPFALAAVGGDVERALLLERAAALGAVDAFLADLVEDGGPFAGETLLVKPDEVQRLSLLGGDMIEQLWPPENGEPSEAEAEALYALEDVFGARLTARLVEHHEWLERLAARRLAAAARAIVPSTGQDA